jgi:hypothetical protein
LFTGTLRQVDFDGKKGCLRLDLGVEIERKVRENESLLRSDPKEHLYGQYAGEWQKG